ncbi:MAG: hypothetical protein WCK53_08980, partial [Methanomicrobiales archaeon]
FLSKVQPKTSVIEVGAGNSYGHPTSATLGRLAQVGSAVYRTDLNGDVTVTTDGTTYNVKTGRGRLRFGPYGHVLGDCLGSTPGR